MTINSLNIIEMWTTKIKMQILASLYAFKLVKTLLLTFFMHFHDNLWSLA